MQAPQLYWVVCLHQSLSCSPYLWSQLQNWLERSHFQQLSVCYHLHCSKALSFRWSKAFCFSECDRHHPQVFQRKTSSKIPMKDSCCHSRSHLPARLKLLQALRPTSIILPSGGILHIAPWSTSQKLFLFVLGIDLLRIWVCQSLFSFSFAF